MSLLGDLGTAIKNKLGGTSVDNTVPIYNGTTCTLQGSSVTISDTNVVTASGGFVGSLTGNASTATKLQTERTIGASGDVTGTATSFNGSANITIPMTLANSGVTAGTYSKVTVDAKGRVTAASTQTMEDIPDATFKRSVRCATTANITLSGAQTIDGIAAVAGDRVLVKNQTTLSQNGIYVVNASNWTRSLDADTSTKISSALVAVDSGTVNGGKLFDNDFKTTDTLGTTAMTWSMNLDDGSLLTAGSTAIGMINYNGTTATAGQFDGGTTTPTGSTRLNFGGYFYPTYINLTGSGDTTTASSHYYVETGSDGFVRPKTLANVRGEIITKAALLSADPYYFSSGVGTSGIAASTNYTLFPAGSDTISLSVGTYNIIIQALVTVATSTVSATLLLNPKGAGTAVGTVLGRSFGSITNGGSPILTNVGSTTLGTAFTVTAASAVAGRAYNAVFEGILNISTAGTLIPSYSFSAALTSGVTTLNAANHIVIYKMTETSVTTAGGWV